MKKILFFLALSSSLVSCSSNEDKKTANTEASNSSIPVSNELPEDEIDIKEIMSKPLPQGAEKFTGEYITDENKSVKLLIRKHPVEKGLLALNLYIKEKTPGMLAIWYDEKQDQVSDRFYKEQLDFTTMKLASDGEILTEVNINLATNKSDTVIYKRRN